MRDDVDTVVTFLVSADAEPNLIGSVTGLVAEHGLTPLALTMRRREREVHLDLVQDGISLERGATLAEKIRSIVPVRSVELRYTSKIRD